MSVHSTAVTIDGVELELLLWTGGRPIAAKPLEMAATSNKRKGKETFIDTFQWDTQERGQLQRNESGF